MGRYAGVASAAFLLCAIVMPGVIRIGKRLKVRQTILSYMDNHMSKSGTPTMGGLGILFAVALACLMFAGKQSRLMWVTVLVTLGYGIVGGIDDFIKVYFKQNKGLSPWQKIVFQCLIAVIVSIFAYRQPTVGGTLYLPFTMHAVSIGKWVIPLYIVVFLAFTNSVNLTDGLDGLAGKVSAAYTCAFAVLIGFAASVSADEAIVAEYGNLTVYAASLIGALVGFLCYNSYPAKVFMGDTGSLALGGGLGCLAVMSRMALSAPIVGCMFVCTSLSVILQVAHYKRTHRRIFRMAPLHHHFERKGIHENKIVTVYTAITAAVGCLTVWLTAFFVL